jgi:hypothetical protein
MQEIIMDFVTSIQCMDGRIQEPIFNFIKREYDIKFVDVITEPGPCKILSQNVEKTLINSIYNRLSISLNNHGSKIIFISGHYDCVGNPVSKDIQIEQLNKSEKILHQKFPNLKVVKLWITKYWEVKEL